MLGMTIMIVSVVFLGLEGATKKFSVDSPEDINSISS
jgi:hypothetical protein